ncbi:MAG: hypothetical protein Kow0031_29720 [Anaerolineae bacterium]
MKKKVVVVVAVLVAMLLAMAGGAYAQGGGETVASGLNGPQGVLVAPDGSVWVIDSGMGGDETVSFPSPESGQLEEAAYGMSARIVKVDADGTQTVAASLPSVLVGMEAIGGARLAVLDGVVYATSGQWTGDASSSPAVADTPAVVKIDGDNATLVANTWPIEAEQNPDGTIIDSHPYGLTAGPDGMLWMADAGANDLLKIDPASGEVSLVAAFDGLPSPLPNPGRDGAMESDPVPTAVAFDSAGNVYVSFLGGFPFLPGTTKVVQVSADGAVSDYATGLTMLTDLRTGPDGNMYAVSFGQFSEQGPTPNSGAIVRVMPGDASEVVVDGLSFPTSIDFNSDGDAYVTINGVGAPGSGEVVMFAGLTGMAGSPMPAMEAPSMEAPAAEAAPAEAAPAADAAPAAEAPATLPATGAELPFALPVALGLVALGVIGLFAGLGLAKRQRG